MIARLIDPLADPINKKQENDTVRAVKLFLYKQLTSTPFKDIVDSKVDWSSYKLVPTVDAIEPEASGTLDEETLLLLPEDGEDEFDLDRLVDDLADLTGKLSALNPQIELLAKNPREGQASAASKDHNK